jgi:hypothetical protein
MKFTRIFIYIKCCNDQSSLDPVNITLQILEDLRTQHSIFSARFYCALITCSVSIKYCKTSVRNTVFLVLDFIVHLSHVLSHVV